MHLRQIKHRDAKALTPCPLPPLKYILCVLQTTNKNQTGIERKPNGFIASVSTGFPTFASNQNEKHHETDCLFTPCAVPSDIRTRTNRRLHERIRAGYLAMHIPVHNETRHLRHRYENRPDDTPHRAKHQPILLVYGLPYRLDMENAQRNQFYSYTAYRTDSIWKTPNGIRIWGDAMVRAIRSRNYDQMPHANMISNDYIYKNYPEGKLSTYAQLGVTSVLIEEDYTGQEWTLKDSTKTLLGYPCQLATCSYHGRDYQAWFTSDIAIDNGPWKFKGLPGLILEVYDTKNHYHFLIEGIERTNIAPVCFYYTLPDPRTAERTDRIRYLQLNAPTASVTCNSRKKARQASPASYRKQD